MRPRRTGLRPTMPAPGSAPGTLAEVEGAEPPKVTFVRYSATEVDEGEVEDIASIPELRARDGILWVDICGLGDVAILETIGQAFGLHPLALEDVVHPQRSKVEDYPDHLYIVVRRALEREPGHTEQVSLFVGTDFVVTFRERQAAWLDPIRRRIQNAQARLRARGTDYLAYAILDAVVDHSFPAVEAFGDRLDALETALLHGPTRDVGSEIQATRQGLLHLRRAVWPLLEALASLMRGDHELVAEETLIYLRDCNDHVVRVLELIDTYRELAADLMDLHLSNLSSHMNEVMKTLTIIATLFIPLSFIAGLYGMNFDREASPFNMPELGWTWGYPFALAMMVAVAVILLLYFRRKGWLGKA